MQINRGLKFVAIISLLSVMLFGTAGCDSSCGDCPVEAEVAVVIEEQGPYYRHTVDVYVSDIDGFSLGGVDVDLTIAMVPEQRMVASTTPDGYARFYFDAPADVLVMAYVCAPDYECNASDVGTITGGGSLLIQVELHP